MNPNTFFPIEILCRIFSHLNYREREKISGTCRLWRDLSLDPLTLLLSREYGTHITQMKLEGKIQVLWDTSTRSIEMSFLIHFDKEDSIHKIFKRPKTEKEMKMRIPIFPNFQTKILIIGGKEDDDDDNDNNDEKNGKEGGVIPNRRMGSGSLGYPFRTLGKGLTVIRKNKIDCRSCKVVDNNPVVLGRLWIEDNFIKYVPNKLLEHNPSLSPFSAFSASSSSISSFYCYFRYKNEEYNMFVNGVRRLLLDRHGMSRAGFKTQTRLMSILNSRHRKCSFLLMGKEEKEEEEEGGENESTHHHHHHHHYQQLQSMRFRIKNNLMKLGKYLTHPISFSSSNDEERLHQCDKTLKARPESMNLSFTRDDKIGEGGGGGEKRRRGRGDDPDDLDNKRKKHLSDGNGGFDRLARNMIKTKLSHKKKSQDGMFDHRTRFYIDGLEFGGTVRLFIHPWRKGLEIHPWIMGHKLGIIEKKDVKEVIEYQFPPIMDLIEALRLIFDIEVSYDYWKDEENPYDEELERELDRFFEG